MAWRYLTPPNLPLAGGGIIFYETKENSKNILGNSKYNGHSINGPLGDWSGVYVVANFNEFRANLANVKIKQMSSREKKWVVLPKISDDFIKKYPEYGQLVLQLLFNRGLKEKEEIEEFLNSLCTPCQGGILPPLTPPYKGGELSETPPLYKGRLGGAMSSFDPFLFNNMEAAVDLIIKHIKEGNKIVVYGDYDADGVTAAAVLIETLSTLNAKTEVYIPDRVSEGYGLNKEAIDEIKNGGVKLIITVDNGIRNKEEVDYAISRGVDVVVTDHHIPSGDKNELPNCLIINPAAEGEKYSFKNLAGVGVAFKVVQAVILKSTLGYEIKNKLEKRVLDLVAIGTVADCVTILGENRVLVKKGLEALNNNKRLGLNELIKSAQINNGKKLDSRNIAFQIAPRLNSAGRMEHANTAFELLTTKSKEEAGTIAHWLNEKNYERQKATDEIVDCIEAEIDEQFKAGKLGAVIVAASPEDKIWNEGVVGLVAGKLSEKYYRPAIVLTKSEDGYKGSGRSIEEFNIIEALEGCADSLEKFGGHKQACGLSLKSEKLEKFKIKIEKIAAEKLKGVDLTPKIEIEAKLNLSDLNEKLTSDVEKFSPFGQGNERPKFLSRDCVIADKINMGIDGQHVKLRIRNWESGIGNLVSAIGFGQAGDLAYLRIGDKIDIVYYVELNEFNGKREVQLRIIDIKQAAI